MNFLKKLDYWINSCFKNDSWFGILTGFIFTTTLIAVSFLLPLSKFGKMYMFLLIGFINFALAVGVIRLIKKRRIKRLANQRLDAENQ